MTPRTIPLWVVGIAASCALLQPRFEAVDPEYGYVDGCTDIILQGAEIGTDAAVEIGGVALLSISAAEHDPAFPEYAQDVGFKYFGVTGPAPDGVPGYYDVVMKIPTEGKEEALTRTLHKGFYYLACPASVHVDAVVLPEGEAESADTAAPLPAPVLPGDTIPVIGCGLDSEFVTAELRNVDGTVAWSLPLTSACGTAQVTITVPPAALAGDYYLVFVHEDGTISGLSCGADTGVDTDGDTGLTCTYGTTVTIGGAP